jgi:hypothetical protein
LFIYYKIKKQQPESGRLGAYAGGSFNTSEGSQILQRAWPNLGWVKQVWSKKFEFKGKNLGGYEDKLKLAGYSWAISVYFYFSI